MLANSNHLRGAFMSEPQESMVYDVDDEHEEAPVSRLHHPPNILCEQDVVFKCYLFFLTGPIDIDSNYQVLYVYIYIYKDIKYMIYKDHIFIGVLATALCKALCTQISFMNFPPSSRAKVAELPEVAELELPEVAELPDLPGDGKGGALQDRSLVRHTYKSIK